MSDIVLRMRRCSKRQWLQWELHRRWRACWKVRRKRLPEGASGLEANWMTVLFVVVEQTEDVVFGEVVAALEEVEFDGKGKAGDLAA